MDKSSSDPKVNRKEVRSRKPARTMTKAERSNLFWCGCSGVDMLEFLIK